MKSSDSKIMLISNGYGEDVIGAQILKSLYNELDLGAYVLPTVGKGKAYNSLATKIVGYQKKLPSGGFARNSIVNFWNDIKEGLLGLTLNQIKTIKTYGKKVNLVVVVGDIYILFLAGLFTDRNIIFLPTAKSEYINGHYWIEKYIMRKYADLVLPRDDKTSRELKNFGINSNYVGNVMMDCFEMKNVDFNLKENDGIIGLLPGSRQEAYDNIIYFLKIIEEIEKNSHKRFKYITAVAGNLKKTKIKEKLSKTEWNLKKTSLQQPKSGIKILIESPSTRSQVYFIYHHFGDILKKADLFIGQAGTANEQAVGMGKPVVIFPSQGSQFTKKFAQAQKSLLGKSVYLCSRNKKEIAGKVLNIKKDRHLYQKMSEEGKKRMGSSGATEKVVSLIKQFLGEDKS